MYYRFSVVKHDLINVLSQYVKRTNLKKNRVLCASSNM